MLFTPKKASTSSSIIKPNQSDDSDRGSEIDMANQSLFTSNWPSSPNSTIKQNLRDDSDTGTEKDMANQIFFNQKGHQLQGAESKIITQITRSQPLTRYGISKFIYTKKVIKSK